MNNKKNKEPQVCIFSKKVINSFGGKKDRDKSGIHTSFGPVHREKYSEYESLVCSIKDCVCDALGVHPFGPISQRANSLISEIGKICALEHAQPEEVIPRFRDKITRIRENRHY